MSAPNRPAKAPRSTWLYKNALLVAQLDEGPGNIRPTRPPALDAPPLTCAYAHGQCFSAEWEPDVLKGLGECSSFDELLKRMRYYKYRVETSAPRQQRRPYVRL